jgi:hypothetical protein
VHGVDILRACCSISSARFAWTTSWLGIAARGARIEYIAFDDFLPNGVSIPEPACLAQKSLKATSVFSKKDPRRVAPKLAVRAEDDSVARCRRTFGRPSAPAHRQHRRRLSLLEERYCPKDESEMIQKGSRVA